MLDVIQKIRRLLTRKDKISLAAVALLMAVSSLLEIAGIGVVVTAVTLILVPGSELPGEMMQSASHFVNCFQSRYGAGMMLGAIAGIFIFKAVFSYMITAVSAKFIYGKQSDLAVRMYENFLKGDYAETASRPVADMDVNIHYCSLLSPYMLLPLAQLAGDISTMILLGSALAAVMPLITLGGIAFMTAAGGIIQFCTSRINHSEGEKFSRAETENSILRLSGLNNTAYIKSVVSEAFFVKRYRSGEQSSNRSGARIFTIGQLPRFSLECAAVLLMLTILAVMLERGVPKAQILATFTAIVAVMARILPALSRSHYNLMRIKQSKYMFDRLADDLTGFPQENTAPAGTPPSLEHSLVLENVSYIHSGASAPTPEPFSVSIPAGSSCGVAGKTGCGKSTLIEMLLGLRRPATGTILADGSSIFNDIISWRRQIGYVPQNIHLIPGTLRENVAFGAEPEFIDDERVKAALTAAQLEDFALDRPVAADGNNLSGGQRQRIGIARALYRDVKLLILDEATSNLDQETENAFVEALDTLRGKVTMIVIAHRENTLEKCDKVIRLTEKSEK